MSINIYTYFTIHKKKFPKLTGVIYNQLSGQLVANTY